LLEFSHDSRFIASTSSDNIVRIWDAWTGEQKTLLEGHLDTVSSLRFSSDGKSLASGSHDGTVRIWDTRGTSDLLVEKKDAVTQGGFDWFKPIGFSPDGCNIISSSTEYCNDRSVRAGAFIWDSTTGEEKAHIREFDFRLLRFSPSGTRIASEGWNGISIWDLQEGTRTRDFDVQWDRSIKVHVSSLWFQSDDQCIAAGWFQ
jgi:WD40 repeat protein